MKHLISLTILLFAATAQADVWQLTWQDGPGPAPTEWRVCWSTNQAGPFDTCSAWVTQRLADVSAPAGSAIYYVAYAKNIDGVSGPSNVYCMGDGCPVGESVGLTVN